MFNRDEAHENNLYSSIEVEEALNSPTRRDIETIHSYLQLLQIKFDQPQEILHQQQKMLDEQNRRLQRIYADSKQPSKLSSNRTGGENSWPSPNP